MGEEIDHDRAEWLWDKVCEYQSAEAALLNLLLKTNNHRLWLRWHKERDELIESYNQELMSE
jgi:hypothetical protein